MIEQLTKQEISQIKQEIESLASEERDKRGGLRISPTDRQIATNTIAKGYGMTGIDLARMVADKSRRAVKENKATGATAQQMMEEMAKKHAAEMETLKLAIIAELEKSNKKQAQKDGRFSGQDVAVFGGMSGADDNWRIRGRGVNGLHIAYVDGLEKANKMAANIQRLIDSIVSGAVDIVMEND